MEDLFETPELLPQEVQDVLNSCVEMDNTYNDCCIVLKKLNKVGYTFDYGLDAEPYNLRKI